MRLKPADETHLLISHEGLFPKQVRRENIENGRRFEDDRAEGQYYQTCVNCQESRVKGAWA